MINYMGQVNTYVVVNNIQDGNIKFYNPITSDEEIHPERMFDIMWNGIVIMNKK